MGSLKVVLNPDAKGLDIPKNPVEVVFPLKWMHDFLKDPFIGTKRNLEIILSLMVSWDNDNLPEIIWSDYGIKHPAFSSKQANPSQRLTWIDVVIDTIQIESGEDKQKIREILSKKVPFSVLTGWDMDVGQQDWGNLFDLLQDSSLDEIRVEIADDNLLRVIAEAVDSDGSLRTDRLEGWRKWMDASYFANARRHEKVHDFLKGCVVFPMGLFQWGDGKGAFYSAINKKVIK